MKLAEQLGGFAGQLSAEGGLRAVTIEYEGAVARLNTRPLTAIALKGLLGPLMDSVNMVNAPVVAKERNIAVSEVKHERECDYQTLMRITVDMDGKVRDVAGTLFADAHPRIVSIKGITVEAEVAPHMLYVTNEDKPGFIGALGTILGESGINIATFNLGRRIAGEEAICLVAVDGPIPDAVVEKVRGISQVKQAQALDF
ncbi:ACT domain-containing protein [Oleomonas cavernae]